jgi:excisionase family DNA binding protein
MSTHAPPAERSGETTAPEPALLDVRGVSRLLNCSPRHVYRLCDADRMPRPIRLGTLLRWKRRELEEWLASGCQPVRPAKGAAR